MSDLRETALDLVRCEQEPIHAPGAIQSASVLLLFDAQTGRLAAASDNLAPYFGATAADLLGAPRRALLRRASRRQPARHRTRRPASERALSGPVQWQGPLGVAVSHRRPAWRRDRHLRGGGTRQHRLRPWRGRGADRNFDAGRSPATDGRGGHAPSGRCRDAAVSRPVGL
ncbi:hypothetical protein [Rhodobacter capsulatus]|uniref:hypothetical protein n=1 Tax=Rhodobacter capsulatus TaxID=1061 RepID=UPI00402772F3